MKVTETEMGEVFTRLRAIEINLATLTERISNLVENRRDLDRDCDARWERCDKRFRALEGCTTGFFGFQSKVRGAIALVGMLIAAIGVTSGVLFGILRVMGVG